MFRHRLGATICRLLSLLAAGCLRHGGSGEIRVVVDMHGRRVAIPREVRRVVGTGGAADEWILLLGHPEKLVATSVSFRSNPWVRKVHPGIEKIPAPYSNGDVNIEALLATRPQLAILLPGMKPQERMEKVGIPVAVVERRDFQDLEDGIRLAGDMLGSDEKAAAERYRAYFDSNLARIRSRTAGLSGPDRPRVLYLGGNGLSTEGKGTLVQSWIEVAGGRNVAADSGYAGMGRTLSMEQVLRWDPQVLICMSAKTFEQILSNPQWSGVRAVRDGKVFVNPRGVYSWGVRSAEEALQVLWAAKTIHPELFPDLDMVSETRRFHRRFYGCDLSEAEARWMIAARNPDGSSGNQ